MKRSLGVDVKDHEPWAELLCQNNHGVEEREQPADHREIWSPSSLEQVTQWPEDPGQTTVFEITYLTQRDVYFHQ